MLNHKTIVLLLSGGLDSVTLMYWLHDQGHSIHPVMVDYRQKHVQELQFAKLHAQRLNLLFTTLTIPDLGSNDETWIVPNRNMILVAHAVSIAVRAGADTVAIGCNAGDAAGFPDCRLPFVARMNLAIRGAGYDHIELVAPFIDWPKWKIAALAQEIGIKANEIWTCYRGGKIPCGTCPACVKLKEAIAK